MSDQSGSMIGKVIGNYEIQRELGRGGMGVVYRAHEQSLQRTVALKILPENLARDPGFVKRFVREARAAAQLSHPNIVHVYAVGEQDGVYYIAMEYITGRTLAQHIRERGRLDVREALYVTAQVADALTDAHARDIIHRDIKPQNIMLDQAGRVKVMDFGLARQTVGNTNLTETGAMVGTPAYMAPEQIKGTDVGGRADIYSLGITLYEMLTGHPPFQADTPLALIYQVMQEPCPPPVGPDFDVPEPVLRILARMTAKNAEERYPYAKAIVNEIHAFLGDASGVFRQTPTPPVRQDAVSNVSPPPLSRVAPPRKTFVARVKTWTRRLIVTTLCVAILLGSAAAAWYVLEKRLPGPVQQAQSAYSSGSYAEAYKTLNAYLSEHEGRWINRSDNLLTNWLKKYVPKQITGATHAEAPCLMGFIGLKHRDEVVKGLGSDGASSPTEVENNTRYETLLDRAVAIDPTYSSRVAEEVATSIQEKLNTVRIDAAAQQLAKTCSAKVAAKEFGAAMESLNAFVKNQDQAAQQVEELVSLLGRFDSTRAHVFSQRLDSLKTSDEDAKRAQAETIQQVVPDMAAGLNAFTADDVTKNIARPGGCPPNANLPDVALFSSLFDQYASNSAVRDLYGALLNAYLVLAETLGTPPETTWNDLGVVAVAHPQEYLRPLLAAVPRSPSLALRLLELTPDPAVPNTTTTKKFSESVAQTIRQAVADMFVKAAVAHSALTNTQPYDTFCNTMWPGVNMQAIGEELAERMPRFGEQDDTFFAAAWTYMQIRDQNPTTPLVQFSPEAYLAKFPRGRHASLFGQSPNPNANGGSASNAEQPVVTPEDRKALEEVTTWLAQANQEAANSNLENAARLCRRILQAANNKPALADVYLQASDLSKWVDLAGDPTRRFVVEGLMTANKSFLTQIRDNTNDSTVSIAQGQMIAGYRLESVSKERREAILSKDGVKYTIAFSQK